MILDSLQIPKTRFEAATGWALKPEGACKGDVCVPLPSAAGEQVDVTGLAAALGMPLVQAEGRDVWALGPECLGGRALTSAEAPDVELADLDGRPFRLSSLRGQKILLYAWAPY